MEEENKTEIDKELDMRKKVQIVFLIVSIIAVIMLFWTTLTIIKYKDMIKNPIGANLNQFNIAYCMCHDFQGKFIPIKSTGYNGTLDVGQYFNEQDTNYKTYNLTLPKLK